MNLSAYNKLTKDNSFYKEVDVSNLKFDGEFLTIHDEHDLGDIYITDLMKDSLCKFVGLSSSINKGLYSTDKELWYKVLTKLYNYYSKSSIILLVSEDSEDHRYYVKGLCNSTRELLTNVSFINSIIKYYNQYDNITITDIGYTRDLVNSHVVVTCDTVHKDVNDKEFTIGVVFRNDELNGTYCRMVINYSDGIMYYLPPKYYNVTTSRYMKTTADSKEALEIVMLRVFEDLTSDVFESRLGELMNLIGSSKYKFISRMEYERTKSLLSNVSSSSDISDEEYNDILEDLSSIDDFETIYGSIENDYLWKCTAIGGTSLYDLLELVGSISKDHQFYPEDNNLLREFMGEYLTIPRVCQLLAKKL